MMSFKRVHIFPLPKYPKQAKGKVLMLPDSFKELLNNINLEFGITCWNIYFESGAEITSIETIRDDDKLYFEEEKGNCADDVNEWVSFNIGGKTFVTTKGTILAKEPDSFLAKLISTDNQWNNSVDKNGSILIDKSPSLFKPILHFLRTGSISISSEILVPDVIDDAKFYGITSMVDGLEKYMEEQEDPPMTREKVIPILMSTSHERELRFQGLNMNGVDLSNLDLRHVNFRYCRLNGANFSRANLAFAVFDSAQCEDANFDNATLFGVKMCGTNLERAMLSRCEFANLDTSEAAVLRGSNLRDADLHSSRLYKVDMRVTNLRNANLTCCNLSHANLAGSDLRGCNFTRCDLTECNMKGANVENATFSDVAAIRPWQYIQNQLTT